MIKKERKLGKEEIKGLKRPDQVLKAGVLNARIFNNNTKTARFSFSVSKKVGKKAVDRNRAKRIGFLVLQQYIGTINNVSIQFYFTSLPKDRVEVEKDVSAILKDLKK